MPKFHVTVRFDVEAPSMVMAIGHIQSLIGRGWDSIKQSEELDSSNETGCNVDYFETQEAKRG